MAVKTSSGEDLAEAGTEPSQDSVSGIETTMRPEARATTSPAPDNGSRSPDPDKGSRSASDSANGSHSDPNIDIGSRSDPNIDIGSRSDPNIDIGNRSDPNLDLGSRSDPNIDIYRSDPNLSPFAPTGAGAAVTGLESTALTGLEGTAVAASAPGAPLRRAQAPSPAGAPAERARTPSASGKLSDSQLPVVEPEVYTVVNVIATTRGGRTVLARDQRLRRDVTLRELQEKNPDSRAKFEREALLIARLQHPNIVGVHEVGRWTTGEPFVAMRPVSGRTLDKVIAETKSLDERLALLPHVLAVADALAYAHGLRIVHRDLKPQHVVVGELGETIVVDWTPAADLGLVTSPNAENGDMFALGELLFHAISGAPAPVPAPPLDAVEPNAPIELVEIVHRAMAPTLSERYPSARELADDLRRFQTRALVSTQRGSATSSGGSVVWSRSTLIAAAVLIASIAGALGFFLQP